jgi:protein-arginine kinase activator protein McsA
MNVNCEQCGHDNPDVHLTEVRDGRATERRLCAPCYRQDLDRSGIFAGLSEVLDEVASGRSAVSQ